MPSPNNGFAPAQSARPPRLISTSLCVLLCLLLSAATASASEIQLGSGGFVAASWQNPFDITLADWDSDGDLDVMAASQGNDGVGLWLRQPDLTWAFTSLAVSASPASASFVEAGDIDGDGSIDLIYGLGAGASSKVGVVLNKSTLNYVTVSTSLTFSFCGTLADLDGDGDLDGIACDFSSGEVNWFENSASGTSWTTNSTQSGHGSPYQVVTNDVDLDGDLDLVVATSTKLHWMENRLNETITTWVNHNIATSLDKVVTLGMADMTGDGKDDIVASTRDTPILAVWQRDSPTGVGTWTGATFATTAVEDLHLLDGDQDGDVDVFGYTTDGHLTYWENLGTGLVYTVDELINPSLGSDGALALGDVNGDGDTDFVVATGSSDTILVYDNAIIRSSPDFEEFSSFDRGSERPTAMVSADLDDDGDVDIISLDEDGSLAYRDNLGSARVVLNSVGATINGPDAIAVNDIDRDGDLDVILATSAGIEWFEQFSFPAAFGRNTIFASITLQEIAVFDYNADGDADVVGWDSVNSSLVVFSNTGTAGGFAGGTIDSTVNGFTDLSYADFDGDGLLDPVVSADDGITWYKGGSIAQNISGLPAVTITTGDYDRDGNTDIAGYFDEELYIFVNDASRGGGGWVDTQIDFPTNIFALETADFDLDGDLDIAGLGTDESALAEGRERGLLPDSAYGIEGTYTSVVVSDLTLDGYPDLIGLDATRFRAIETLHGQFGARLVGSAPGTIATGAETRLMDIDIEHLGLPFEQGVRLTEFNLAITDGSGTPLTGAQMNAVFASVSVVRRDGIDVEQGRTDDPNTAGVVQITFPAIGGNSVVDAPATQSTTSMARFEVRAELEPDAANTVSSFRVVFVGSGPEIQARMSSNLPSLAIRPWSGATRTFTINTPLFADGFESGDVTAWD